jgi:Ribonucleotide reductase, alpha subunit
MNYESGWERLRESVFLLMLFGLIALASIVALLLLLLRPSGTVSQLVDSASGIHPRYSDQYIRRVRADARDPLCQVLEAAGVPVEDDVMSPTTKVFSFPIKSPDGGCGGL